MGMIGVKPIKVIFLDIDGVLNRGMNMVSWGTPIHRENVEPLNEITRATGAQIVISSSWRLLVARTDEFATLEELYQHLRDHGVEGEFAGITPDLHADFLGRGREIQAWLKDRPHVTNYVILDDSTDTGMPAANTVEINSSTGLTRDKARKAVEILNRG